MPTRSTAKSLLLLVLLTVGALTVGALAPAQAATRRSVSIAVSPASAASGSVVTFTGRLTRSPKGSVVRVQVQEGTSWRSVRSGRTTTATGRYRIPVTLPTIVGRYTYRVVAPRTRTLAKATSATVRVRALELTFVTLTPSASTVTAGSPVTLTGIVRPFTAGGRVLVQRWSGSAWGTIATATLTSHGFYTRSVTLAATSTLRAFVAASGQRAAGTSTPARITVTPADPGDPPAPVIGTAALPAGTVGTPYQTTLSAGGAQGTWTANPLPAGLSLNAATGALTGTPTTAGTTHVVVGFTQTGNPTPAAPKTLDLLVKPRPAPVISTTTLPDGKLFQKYAGQLLATGNPAGTWSITGKPGWLKLDAATGALSGTPGLFDNGDVTVTIGFTETGNPTPATPVTIKFHVDGL